MPNSEASIRVAVSPELRAATDAYCRKNKQPISDVVREAIAEKIGKPALAAMPAGRPRKIK